MCKVFDVAKYILSEIGEVSTMKLQKLCYYSLVEGLISPQQVAIFPNKFEAWANGPVCRDLWNVHKGLFYVDKKIIPDALLSRKKIPVAHKNYINAALEKYGKKTGAELSELTHNEKPWQEAIGNVNSVKNSRRIITHKAIIKFYGKK
ncbi:MAG: DUF4065 domain-containing protein [Candidatus Fibromonas sp.]|jgi:uncharacterized phage-associated protein|nr:DUF4065 domain-containing protein [Candidatus Fibromonas sp.]